MVGWHKRFALVTGDGDDRHQAFTKSHQDDKCSDIHMGALLGKLKL